MFLLDLMAEESLLARHHRNLLRSSIPVAYDGSLGMYNVLFDANPRKYFAPQPPTQSDRPSMFCTNYMTCSLSAILLKTGITRLCLLWVRSIANSLRSDAMDIQKPHTSFCLLHSAKPLIFFLMAASHVHLNDADTSSADPIIDGEYGPQIRYRIKLSKSARPTQILVCKG